MEAVFVYSVITPWAIKIVTDFNAISLLDLEKNCTCDGMNFTHLTWLVLLHYVVKLQPPKMHVNAFSI